MLVFRVAAFRTKSNGGLERGPYSDYSYRWYVTSKVNVKAAKKSAIVKLSKVKGSTGYEVMYSTNTSLAMKDNKFRSLAAGKVKTKIKGLKSGRRYYVKARPVKKYKGKLYRGILIVKEAKIK